ncbi:pirin family protein, partial [uncultured Acinetobacter sp.]
MTNANYTELSHSDDCEKYIQQFIQEVPLRRAEIGQGTVIKRALPSRHKRMIGAWCFLDHAGPVSFPQGDGLDVGPHPHIGLQTFTWMIEGTLMHTDSIGSKQLIRPKQVNLMTAGQGISHTEVAPEQETHMHAAQLWIALPDAKRNMPSRFDHYPELPVVSRDGVEFTVLVGEFLETRSPVEVHSPLLALDLTAAETVRT